MWPLLDLFIIPYSFSLKSFVPVTPNRHSLKPNILWFNSEEVFCISPSPLTFCISPHSGGSPEGGETAEGQYRALHQLHTGRPDGANQPRLLWGPWFVLQRAGGYEQEHSQWGHQGDRSTGAEVEEMIKDKLLLHGPRQIIRFCKSKNNMHSWIGISIRCVGLWNLTNYENKIIK